MEEQESWEEIFKVIFPLFLVATDFGLHWEFWNGTPADNETQPVLERGLEDWGGQRPNEERKEAGRKHK